MNENSALPIPHPLQVFAHIKRLRTQLRLARKLYELSAQAHWKPLPSKEQQQQQHEGEPRA